MNLTTATPVEIDTRLSELSEKARVAEGTITGSLNSMRYSLNLTSNAPEDDVLAAVLESPEWSTSRTYFKHYEEARHELNEVSHEMADLNGEFRDRGGWSRFFMVPGGHIHSSMDCSTCNKNGNLTRFGWLPTLSGSTEAACVAEHGALLCTVCFPSAPVEWTNFYEEQDRAKKAARCTGSGQFMDSSLPSRTGFYSGNWATCSECGDRVSITSLGKIRAHKPQAS